MSRAGIWKFGMCRLLQRKQASKNYQIQSAWHVGHCCTSIFNSFCKRAAGCTPARNHNNSNSHRDRTEFTSKIRSLIKTPGKHHVSTTSTASMLWLLCAPHIVQPRPSPQAAWQIDGVWRTAVGCKDRRSQWLWRNWDVCSLSALESKTREWTCWTCSTLLAVSSCNHFERMTIEFMYQGLLIHIPTLPGWNWLRLHFARPIAKYLSFADLHHGKCHGKTCGTIMFCVTELICVDCPDQVQWKNDGIFVFMLSLNPSVPNRLICWKLILPT